MLSLDWAGGSGEAKSPGRRAGKLWNTVVAILENTVSQRQSLWTQANIGLAKKFVQVYPTIIQENSKELFGQPSTWKKSTLQGPGVLLGDPGFRLDIHSPPSTSYYVSPESCAKPDTQCLRVGPLLESGFQRGGVTYHAAIRAGSNPFWLVCLEEAEIWAHRNTRMPTQRKALWRGGKAGGHPPARERGFRRNPPMHGRGSLASRTVWKLHSVA